VTTRRPEAFLIAGLSAICFFAQAAAFNSVRFDDAYITYRYAQNLASGHGLVFNPGEHILGTTSPGHALLGATFYAFVGKSAFPAIMAVLGCAGWTAQAVCVYALLRDVLGRRGAAFVAAAIALGATRPYFWVSLETNIVAALVLGAFVLASRRRWIGCGLVAGVAVVFRADALVACAALAAVAFLEERWNAWRPVAAFTAVAGGWGVVSLVYFGTLVPHTLHAKVAQGSVGGYALHALFYPSLSVAPWSRLVDSGTDGTWLTVVPMWGLAIAGAVLLGRRSRALAGLAAYGALLLVAYVALHPDTVFRWHVYPATLVFAIFALSALALLVTRLRVPRAVATPLACIVAAGFAIEAARFEEREPALPSYGPRDALSHMVAAYLSAVAGPTDYVDAEEVGTVAYLSGLPMVDHPGLVSDAAFEQLFAAARGRPSRVKWAILNRWEATTGEATFAPYSRMIFEEGPLQLSVYDLRAPAPR
jgi:arabinofuranosyltransferase